MTSSSRNGENKKTDYFYWIFPLHTHTHRTWIVQESPEAARRVCVCNFRRRDEKTGEGAAEMVAEKKLKRVEKSDASPV